MLCKILTVCILCFFLFSVSSCKWQKHSGKNKRSSESKECTCSCNDGEKNDDGKIPTTTTTTRKPPIIRSVPLPDNVDRVSDPCEPYTPPPVPPFVKASGRRISVTKCYEYLWQMKIRKDKADRDQQCKYKENTAILVQAVQSTNNTLENGDMTEVNETQETASPPEPLHKAVVYILGGHDALPKEFPHMGAVGWRSIDEFPKWKFMCGSTLISPNFALTAAHCARTDSRDTTVAELDPKIVRFGVEDLIFTEILNPPIDRDISKIIKHPKYASPKKYFDIALLQFDEPITFSKYVQPACLWQHGDDQLRETTVSGWGVTSPGAHEGHPYLQAASLDVIKSSKCDDLLKTVCNRLWCGLQDHQFCAGQLAGGVDACQGDSGGPLQMKISLPEEARSEGNMHYVIGVTSFGIGCGKKDIPGVYSKVSYFLDWIESVVWPEII